MPVEWWIHCINIQMLFFLYIVTSRWCFANGFFMTFYLFATEALNRNIKKKKRKKKNSRLKSKYFEIKVETLQE